MRKWYDVHEEASDVVVSGRIRLARNLPDYPFHDKMTEQDARNLTERILSMKEELAKEDQIVYHCCNLSKMSELDRASMVEWHIISPLLANEKADTGLMVSEDELASIMVNEEDHLRIQTITGGMHLEKALEHAQKLERYLDDKLQFAFDAKFGYLTACPTNTGTGLRASYMCFLPSLTMTGKINKLTEEVGKYGITIRGIYGEGTRSVGNIYQVSNQKTLGTTEEEIVEHLNQIVVQTLKQERMHRAHILQTKRSEMEDKVYRSYGVLRYAKKLTTEDAMVLLAQLKFGIDCGLIRLAAHMNVYRLMMEIQPANLQKLHGKVMEEAERDACRAAYIEKKLAQTVD